MKYRRTSQQRKYWEYLNPFDIARTRYIEVRLTGRDGIGRTKTVRYAEGFVTSRIDMSNFTCT